MRSALLVAASVAPLLFAAATDASAQPRYGGGFRGGGWHGGGWHGGGGWRGGGWYGRSVGVGWRGGWGGGWRGAGLYRRPYAWGGYYPYRRYWGGYPYWGWGAGLATAATLGAIATYPAYAYPAYGYPVYEVESGAIGGQCSTPVRICTLINPAPLDTGCSCRVAGGRARGVVVGP